jgi:dTDP-4-dehydrorhamnose reductase
VKPFNNYRWSKLGGEASVQIYNNLLILKNLVTEEPLIHIIASGDVLTNFVYHKKI